MKVSRSENNTVRSAVPSRACRLRTLLVRKDLSDRRFCVTSNYHLNSVLAVAFVVVDLHVSKYSVITRTLNFTVPTRSGTK